MSDTPLTVVGAGVVGLAVAAQLAPRYRELVILERHSRHGSETSSRNSEVIHAGLYYPTGSLKARLCVRGRQLLYDLCARRGVPHAMVGKLIVAVSAAELPELERLLDLARANGVPLHPLTAAECRALEPAVPAVAGLLSPTTGILSAHRLMDAFLETARHEGALLQTQAELVGIERRSHDYRLTVRTPAGLESLTSERVVNAAGLEADAVASLAGIDPDAAGYRQHWCKGSYFAVTGAVARRLSRLVYPVPNQVSLGVHAVLGLDGRLRFGPDVEYLPVRTADYSIPSSRRGAFAEAVRRLLPTIAETDLAPDIAGIRPRLQGPGQGAQDFVIAEETARGLPGLVDLVGIDSPGLTAAPAIAEEVAHLLEG